MTLRTVADADLAALEKLLQQAARTIHELRRPPKPAAEAMAEIRDGIEIETPLSCCLHPESEHGSDGDDIECFHRDEQSGRYCGCRKRKDVQ